MRLTAYEVDNIKQAAAACFGQNARVFLFGSRTDDQKKGGDIDLYIDVPVAGHSFTRKIAMLALLYERLGEQKIDIVVSDGGRRSRLIDQVALSEGVLL